MKISPNHKWNPDNPLDLFTTREKFVLLPRLISKFWIGSVFELYGSSKKLNHYVVDGYLGMR